MTAPLWIAWETQRRSINLSARLGCRLRIIDHSRLGPLRYPWSALLTALLIFRERRSLIVVQNPSMVLAAMACACKRLLGFTLVVDRHSNFLLARRGRDDWKARLFLALSRYTLRRADLTLVTNSEIAERVLSAGGRPFVLPDPYPDVDVAPPSPKRSIPEAVFICSWADDEPIAEMMAACEALRGEAVVRATGRPKPRHSRLLRGKPENFRPSGFLADADYLGLLAAADAVVVLTTMPSTLLCGAYEALALGKPLLLSGSRVLRGYFTAGTVHLESHHPEEIARKLRLVLAHRTELRYQGLAFLAASRAAWNARLEELRRSLAGATPARRTPPRAPLRPKVGRQIQAKLFLAAALASVLAAAPARAANYYVSAASGSDANPGSQAKPWKTFSKATATAQAGDSVLVLAGTYSDPASDAFRGFNPAQSGREGAPIVFRSQPPRAAVLTSTNHDNPAFGVNNRQYIVIDGFKVIGGIGLREHADYGVIRNCEVTNGFIQQGDVSLDWGIYLGGASHCLVEHNWVHAPAGLGNKTHNGAAIMIIGVPADCDNNLIRYNEADGGNLWYNAFGQKAGLITGNIWRRNVARNAMCGFMGMGSTDNTKYSRDNLFQENLILDCRYAFELDHFSTGFRIVGNTVKGGSVFLYGGYRDDASAGLSGTEVWNNIFVPAGGSGTFYQRDTKAPDWHTLLAVSDYNAFVGKPAVWNYGSGSIATLADWRSSSGFDAHSLSADPVFADAAKGDYHLAPSSPCRHAGLDRGESPGYASLGPDQGIYPRPEPGSFVGYLWTETSPVDQKRPPPPVNLPAPYYNPIPD